MPALVETMASFGKTWHGEETLIERPTTWANMSRLAQIDWEVELRPTYTTKTDENGNTVFIEVEDRKTLVRVTDNKILGVHSDKYAAVQNKDAGDILDELTLGSGEMEYHTAGSLREGKQIWALGKLVNLTFEAVKGDVTHSYILATNYHDGTGAFRILPTSVRVVCANTMNMALKEGREEGISIRHIGDPRRKIDEARKVLGLATAAAEKYRDLCEHLKGLSFNEQKAQEFIEELLPAKKVKDPDTSKVVEEISAKLANQRAKIMQLVESGQGTDIPGVRGTGYGMLQAVTEYTSHFMTVRGAGTKEEQKEMARQAGAWFGAGNKLNQRARKLLVAA